MMKKMSIQKLLAELIGTFSLTFIVLLSATNISIIPTPILAGLTLGLFVYSIGSISGCHINPAVTIGLLSLNKIKMAEALQYIAAQVVGAILALGALMAIGGDFQTIPELNHWSVFFGEAVGAAILTFGVASVVFEKVHQGASGLVIGGSLLLGISFASLMGAPGIITPAVALGLLSPSIETVLGPIIGGVIGMQAYKHLLSGRK